MYILVSSNFFLLLFLRFLIFCIALFLHYQSVSVDGTWSVPAKAAQIIIIIIFKTTGENDNNIAFVNFRNLLQLYFSLSTVGTVGGGCFIYFFLLLFLFSSQSVCTFAPPFTKNSTFCWWCTFLNIFQFWGEKAGKSEPRDWSFFVGGVHGITMVWFDLAFSDGPFFLPAYGLGTISLPREVWLILFYLHSIRSNKKNG